MALNSNALISEAQLETALQTTFDTPYADFLINTASGFIEKYCNRIIKAANYTLEIYDGIGYHELYVLNPPINSVSAVHSWDTYNDVSYYEYTVKEEYLIDRDKNYIYLREGWSTGVQNFRVTYNGGYATIPSDLEYACIQFCSWINNNSKSMGIKAETIGAYSVTYGLETTVTIGGLAVPAELLSMLANYRLVNI